MFVCIVLCGRNERPEPKHCSGEKSGPVKAGRTTKRDYTTCINMWRDWRGRWKSYTYRNINIT